MPEGLVRAAPPRFPAERVLLRVTGPPLTRHAHAGPAVQSRATGKGGDTVTEAGDTPVSAEPEPTAELPAWRWRRHRAPPTLGALRPSKVQVAALALLTLLTFGPIVALVVALNTDRNPSRQLVTEPPAAEESRVAVSATAVNPTAGELVTRVVVQPQADLLTDGRLARELTLRVNDVRGETTHVFPDGQVPTPVEVRLALVGGAVTQYPFDSYDAVLAAFVTADDPYSGTAESLSFTLDVTTTVTDWDLSASLPGSESAPFATVELALARTGTTTAYAVWMMVLMWGLAATGVLIAWAVVIWQVELPLWVFGYFVGVLFALPPLRDSLPGRPPPGTVFDFVSFYWSVGIVGVTLIVLLTVWIRRSRPTPADAELQSPPS